MNISGVSGAMLQTWLDDMNGSGRTKRNYLAVVSALFRFCIKRKYLPKDAMEEVEAVQQAKEDNGEIEIFTPAEMAEMLNVARPEMIPWLAIAGFAGLRTAELDRLDWQNVNLAAGLVTVTPEAAKMRRQRHVSLAANAVQWLITRRKAAGPVWRLSAVSYQHRAAELARKAGVKVPHNAGRHSFASYHFALHGDAAKTAGELGHADARLLLDVYRNIHTMGGKPITAATATEYFAIKPKGAAEIIPMEAAG